MRLSKYLLTIVLLLALPVSALARGQYYLGATTVDLCASMGASGTYLFWWNGEYSDDTDKACYNSGASQLDGTADAGVIGAAGAINGAIGATLDAANEDIHWTNSSTTIDDAGTVDIIVTLPGELTGNAQLWEISYDANNGVCGYVITTRYVYMIYEGNGAVQFMGMITDQLTVGTTYELHWTWNLAADKYCCKVGTGDWTCIEEDLTAFSSNPSAIALGDYQLSDQSINNSWKVDDFRVREGYEGP